MTGLVGGTNVEVESQTPSTRSIVFAGACRELDRKLVSSGRERTGASSVRGNVASDWNKPPSEKNVT